MDEQLRGGIEAHVEQTREQIRTFKQIFGTVGQQQQELVPQLIEKALSAEGMHVDHDATQ